MNNLYTFLLVLLCTALSTSSLAQGGGIPGCTDPAACNYDPLANDDDGSCEYVIDCNGTCGGNWVLNECGECYNPDIPADPVQFDFSGAPEYFEVPDGVEFMVVEAWGAEGGGNGDGDAIGGLGAYMYGQFDVTPGELIRIHVGEKGNDGVGALGGGGGGGGSFVIRDSNNEPLIISGGGAGAGHLPEPANDGEGGRITELGGAGWYYQVDVTLGGATSNECGGGTGAGGGGWIGSGQSNNWCDGGIAGGGAGGAGGPGYQNDGGYGGGGGGYHGGGGGGGYTGGSGGGVYTGCTNTGGGGGGSYNGGANQAMAANNNPGNGYVIFSFNAVPPCIEDCTDPEACNYNPDADVDDGSCTYPGCMDPEACNYDEEAGCEDESCVYPGCMDPDACNFDGAAGCEGGTCYYEFDCNGTCGGTWVLNECGECYDPDAPDEPVTFNYTGNVVYWQVPNNVTYLSVEAWGAEGGSNGDLDADPGLGAYIKGDFTVTGGETLRIIVGEKGHNGTGSIGGGGGGGGSWVINDDTNTPMIIAGGGGGATHLDTPINDGEGGRITELGGAGGYYQVPVTEGGATDNGCGGGSGSGGGGWIGAGQSNNWCTGGEAAGGAGGIANNYDGHGGFGGGGGAYHSGGGGGGYTGGSGGDVSTGCESIGGGGGGSFNGGTAQVLTADTWAGNGQIIISFNAIPDCTEGCMDEDACNYDPEADIEDGSCTYPGCTDFTACNFDPLAGCDDESCTYPGCIDPAACNFDPEAGCSNNMCIYVVDCNGICGGDWIINECGDCYDPNGVGDDEINFNYSGAPEYWEVPAGVTAITIEAYGAEGGGNGDGDAIGGLGAYMQGDFAVIPGQMIRVHVGERGNDGVGALGGGGGGGGSFVVLDDNNTPLLIAGGGAGAGHLAEPANDGEHGRITEEGGAGWYYQVPVTDGGATDNTCGGGTGAGGGGWLGTGQSNNWTNGGEAGGGEGGLAGTYQNDGGYGGGGGGYHGGGGGGGYTGGSGGGVYTGCTNTGGGGGGSYNGGTNQLMAEGSNSGNGYVIIYFEGIPDCYGGCIDETACNYDEGAGFDDGSCAYPECGDLSACNYADDAWCYDDSVCTYPGCDDPVACNYDDTAGCDDGSCVYVPVYGISGSLDVNLDETQTYVYPSTTGSTYEWTVIGGTIISGQGTSTIEVEWTGPPPASITVVETDDEGCSSAPVSVDVDINTSIESLLLAGISVYPNPVQDQLTIDMGKVQGEYVALRVFDITGKVVQSDILTNQLQYVDVSEWANGVYQFVFTQSDAVRSVRIVVGR